MLHNQSLLLSSHLHLYLELSYVSLEIFASDAAAIFVVRYVRANLSEFVNKLDTHIRVAAIHEANGHTNRDIACTSNHVPTI